MVWLEDNPAAEKAECDRKQKEVEGRANHMLKKAYESANAGVSASGDDDAMGADLDGAGDHNMDEPSVEEVD